MMIAPPIHTPIRPATSPPKTLWPVLEELVLISSKLRLKLPLQIVRLFEEAGAPAGAVRRIRRRPGDELEFPFMDGAILTGAILVVPNCLAFARSFVRRPIGQLTLFALKARVCGQIVDLT